MRLPLGGRRRSDRRLVIDLAPRRRPCWLRDAIDVDASRPILAEAVELTVDERLPYGLDVLEELVVLVDDLH